MNAEADSRIHPKLILTFFGTFSAFECGLKREGFLQARRGHPEADWRAFAASIRGRFADIRSPGFAERAEFLEAHPPHRQVLLADGSLGWKALSRSSASFREEFLLNAVKTARNNLFHGGKYPTGPVVEVARDTNILEASLIVLRGCCDLDQRVRRWVEDIWTAGYASALDGRFE